MIVDTAAWPNNARATGMPKNATLKNEKLADSSCGSNASPIRCDNHRAGSAMSAATANIIGGITISSVGSARNTLSMTNSGMSA